jgi:hypothetical protein
MLYFTFSDVGISALVGANFAAVGATLPLHGIEG